MHHDTVAGCPLQPDALVAALAGTLPSLVEKTS
jgi:Ni,Fe-hydrogenase III small subunit